MRPTRPRAVRAALALAALLGAALPTIGPAHAAPPSHEADPGTFTPQELVESGHRFFGSVSRGLAMTMQEAVRRWGEPNGYILGEEGAGAFVGGLRYGEGVLYSRRGRQQRIFWQGPSFGFDFGGEGARTMMLVYNMQGMDSLQRRFLGVDGSAYMVGGFGLTAAIADDIVVVPIRSGVGARLGVNLGYLKFTDQPTWNPF